MNEEWVYFFSGSIVGFALFGCIIMVMAILKTNRQIKQADKMFNEIIGKLNDDIKRVKMKEVN